MFVVPPVVSAGLSFVLPLFPPEEKLSPLQAATAAIITNKQAPT